jgi:hypothetical protein
VRDEALPWDGRVCEMKRFRGISGYANEAAYVRARGGEGEMCGGGGPCVCGGGLASLAGGLGVRAGADSDLTQI